MQNRRKPGEEVDYPYGQWLRVSYPARRGGAVDLQRKNRDDGRIAAAQGDGSLSLSNKESDQWKVGGGAGGGGSSSSRDPYCSRERETFPKERGSVERLHDDDMTCPVGPVFAC